MCPSDPLTGLVTFGLVKPSEPGNVGASARSLAAFGFRQLLLIDPVLRRRDRDRAMAVRMGREVLQQAEEISSDEARARLSEFDEVWGTSARSGRHRRNESAPEIVTGFLERGPGRLLILFGSERDGLGRRWLDACSSLIQLPTSGGPLNLAQAVTVIAYELRLQAEVQRPRPLTRSMDAEAGARGPQHDDAAATPGERRELLVRSGELLSHLAYPTRRLHGHPPQAYLDPLRRGPLSRGQVRWLLGLITCLERLMDR
jgi:tRNA C32,U32 (ribose-2'-O)-methylase TrmJ